MITVDLPAMFIADACGLDFLNSVATPIDEVVDWIGDGQGLLNWLAQSGLVSKSRLTEIRQSATPAELDGVADEARRLREWFRALIKRQMGRPLDAGIVEELSPLSRILELDEAYQRLVLCHGRLALEREQRWRSPAWLLVPVAEALARVIVDENFEHVKACEGDACTLIFADHTRGHARRWCSMSICGNRAKVAAHRRRKRAHTQ